MAITVTLVDVALGLPTQEGRFLVLTETLPGFHIARFDPATGWCALETDTISSENIYGFRVMAWADLPEGSNFRTGNLQAPYIGYGTGQAPPQRSTAMGMGQDSLSAVDPPEGGTAPASAAPKEPLRSAG